MQYFAFKYNKTGDIQPSSENQFCSRIKPLIKFAPKSANDPNIKIELDLGNRAEK
jgi:hypothetical protein